MVSKYDPPRPRKTINPLNVEMAVRHKRALQRLLGDGDISKAEFDALWAKTLERVKAGV
jgi:hypothetical protein